MSRATDLARAEAEEVESEEDETPEETPEEEPEQAIEQPPEEPPAGPTEAQFKAFDKENRRHESRLAQIMGSDFAFFHACAACEGVGWTAKPVEEPPEYKGRSDAVPCPDCAALGMTLTGSKVPGQELLPCARCVGAGWVTKASETIAVPPSQATAPPPGVIPPAPPGYIMVPVGVPADNSGA